MSRLNMEYARLWVGSKGFRDAVNKMDSSYNIGEVLRQVLENAKEVDWTDPDFESVGYILPCLFTWGESPQGFNYWANLD